MTDEDVSKQRLIELNRELADMEQRSDAEAIEFFNRRLADSLVGKMARPHSRDQRRRELTAGDKSNNERAEP